MACRSLAIIWANAGILLIGPLGRNLREILIEIYTSYITIKNAVKDVWKKAIILPRPQCV